MKKTNRKQWRKSGFTLIEVVVVIIILVTLASIATPLYLNYVKKANVGAAKTQIRLLDDALTGYRLDVGTYPDSTVGLRALVPKDPWGNDYIYLFPGEHREYDLMSYGADGQPGGSGENADITNWGE